MYTAKQNTVLIAVLDWGLGHAGRSIPLIAEVNKQGTKVIIASSGRAGFLLRDAYPELTYLECPAYRVHYSGQNMYWSIFWQLPKIFLAIIQEHFWLRKLVRKFRIDAVISDSRFGCFQEGIPSIIVTHQLRLRLRPPYLSKIVNWFYQRLMDRFDAVWVPDQPDGLSGALSYPSPFSNTRYLGTLSRFQPVRVPVVYDLLVLLSGPEPQRTRLEEIVASQLKLLPHLKVLLVQGKTDLEEKRKVDSNIELVSYLSGMALQNAIAGSRVVLCRSGYSSLMDLAAMGKKAILIPTPGQPEQEYLAQRCQDLGWAHVCRQADMNLKDSYEKVNSDNKKISPGQTTAVESLSGTIRQFLASIGKI